MNTQPTNLPFTLDSAFDYILNEADRQKFAPKLETDEWWNSIRGSWEVYGRILNPDFHKGEFYRRRKTSGWVSVKERLPEGLTPVLVTDGKHVDACCNGYPFPKEMAAAGWTHWQPWTLPALPQPPKPAAEVAFESIWPDLLKNTALTKESTYDIFEIGWNACNKAKDHKEAL